MNLKNQQTPPINTGQIQVEVEQFFPKNNSELEKHWLLLEQTASKEFFLSWKWIGSWLETIGTNQQMYLVKAMQNNKVVGLGVFAEHNIVRHNLIASKQWFLHRTGQEEKDQIWIENNGFLLCEQNKNHVNNTMWQHLLTQHSNVDEFIVNLVKKSPDMNYDISVNNYQKFKQQQELGYKIALTNFSSLDNYLSTLSKNTRQQINRSIKLIMQQGELKFTPIEQPQDQIKLLEKTKHWHIQKWKNTLTPSGFENKIFCQFHNHLLGNTHPSATTIAASLNLNEEVIGAIYCFAENKNIYFYLSCIKPIENNKIKLGLVMHILMIEWLILQKNTYSEYDFLAGDAQYKRSLSSIRDEYYQLTIQKNRLKFTIETKAKKTASSLKNLKLMFAKQN